MPNGIGPSSGFLRRMYDSMFGGPLSESNAEAWPELAEKWAKMEVVERPDVARNTRSVRPMNWIEKKFLSARKGDMPAAVTWPWGTIALNREALENEAKLTGTDTLGNTLAHELEHVDQLNREGAWNYFKKGIQEVGVPEFQRSFEKPAYQAGWNRPRPTDIELPPPHAQDIPALAAYYRRIKRTGN